MIYTLYYTRYNVVVKRIIIIERPEVFPSRPVRRGGSVVIYKTRGPRGPRTRPLPTTFPTAASNVASLLLQDDDGVGDGDGDGDYCGGGDGGVGDGSLGRAT